MTGRKIVKHLFLFIFYIYFICIYLQSLIEITILLGNVMLDLFWRLMEVKCADLKFDKNMNKG